MADNSQTQHAAAIAPLEGDRAALHHALIEVAERELDRALREHSRPMMGMYAHPSGAANAAVQRAVRTICQESHRLGLRAEELIIGVKQAWVQLAPVRARHLGDRDGDVLREVVSNSIELYFEAQDVSAPKRRD